MGDGSPKLASTPTGAVFLSYASQDTEAAQKICDALRAAGIEVWFDKSELRGGDVWDRQIREQIHDCRLFIPIISANTEARDEGYFRREWGLAVDRTRDMDEKKAFLLPIVIDDTVERNARVPEKLHGIQWSRLPGGVTPPAFVTRVRTLLGTPAPLATANKLDPALTSAPLTPTQNRRNPWIALGLAALVVIGGAWLALLYSSLHRGAQVGTAGQSQPANTEKSIAVLPFADLSEKRDQEYFADGMAEEVIDLLARIPGLKVIGRTSSFQFKGKSQDLRTVGNTLGVSYVVEGSVRKSGDRLRVTAQLLSTQDGSHLWSDTYDASVDNALDIQDRIAANLVRALQVFVGAADYSFARPVFKSSEAYDLYLRGIHALDRNDKEGVESAVASFQQVLALDPTSVGAAELLSLAQAVLAYEYVEPITGFERARVSAQHALGLDPKSSIAYQALALVHLYYDWDWAGAESNAKEALRLNPRDPGAMGNLGDVYRALGRWEESARQYETAISSDPLDPVWHSHLGTVWLATGRLHEAEAEKRRVLQISPTYAWGHFLLGQVLLTRGSLEAALAEMQQETGEEARDFGLAIVYHAMGRSTDSAAALARLIQQQAQGRGYSIAQAYGYRVELNEAFVWLERAYHQKDADLWSIKLNQADPLLKDFVRDPRFAEFLHKMNLPQ